MMATLSALRSYQVGMIDDGPFAPALFLALLMKTAKRSTILNTKTLNVFSSSKLKKRVSNTAGAGERRSPLSALRSLIADDG